MNERVMNVRNGALFSILLSLLFIISCGSGGSRLGGQVKSEAEYDRPTEEARYSSRSAEKKMEGSAGLKDFDQSKPDPNERDPGKNKSDSKSEDEVVIIYEADCVVSVINVRDTIASLAKMAKDSGGYVEKSASSDSYRSAQITIRVPQAAFEIFIEELSKIGTVESKSVKATNVTDAFNDLKARLESSQKVRDRLGELLKKAKNAADKIAILKEIDRVNAQIESMKARLEYLKGLSDFSTIRITLKAERQTSVKRYIPSPFEWVRALTPEKRTLTKTAREKFKNPDGFFHLEFDYNSGGTYLYELPGNVCGIRAGVTENYPKMNITFWKEAFERDAEMRMYKSAGKKDIKSHAGEFSVYHFSVSAGRYFTAAINVTNDSIVVVEAVYDGEKSFKEKKENVESMIASYGGEG